MRMREGGRKFWPLNVWIITYNYINICDFFSLGSFSFVVFSYCHSNSICHISCSIVPLAACAGLSDLCESGGTDESSLVYTDE